jgi:hypothetical protein
MRVVHEIGKYVAVEKFGVERLRYNYQMRGDARPTAPKPFIHPIRTPDGLEMTADAPLDHFWHRGVWFAWKYVNGVNYWEENQELVGRQIATAPPPVLVDDENPDWAMWGHVIEWKDWLGGKENVRLLEDRTFTCQILDDGAILLDLESVFTPTEDVILDRTPYTTWGGYGGLVVRMTQALQRQNIVFDDGTTTQKPVGERHRWGAIQGQLDTGRDRFAAFVFMPSPRNFRHPEPFYGDARPFYNFFGPAPLFHEPHPLAAGENLRYAVRLAILPRPVSPDEVNLYYNEWSEREGGPARYGNGASAASPEEVTGEDGGRDHPDARPDQ